MIASFRGCLVPIGPARLKACEGGLTGTVVGMLIGDARVPTTEQDLTAQKEGLVRLGVAEPDIYVDHGLTGTNRSRPGLRHAMAAVRAGDTLVVTQLGRLARSLPDARILAAELTTEGGTLNIGRSVYDPEDPIGRLLFNVLGIVAEFEADLIRMRTPVQRESSTSTSHSSKSPRRTRHDRYRRPASPRPEVRAHRRHPRRGRSSRDGGRLPRRDGTCRRGPVTREPVPRPGSPVTDETATGRKE